MKSYFLSSSVVLALSFSMVVACGDSGNGGAGGGTGGNDGGNGGTGGDPSTGGGPGGPTVGGGGSGGAPGDGNDSFAEAGEFEAGDGFIFVQDDLEDPATDIDFFKFTAVAGAYLIRADAKPTEDEFAPGYMDTVIKVYNSAMQQVAANDDPYPRNSQDSSVNTILEAGEYFITIEEFCNAVDCPDERAYYNDITETAYAISVSELNPEDNSIIAEAAEPNSTLANASVMEYEAVSAADPNNYFLSVNFGDWSNADTVDAVKLTVPANLEVDPLSRPSGRIIIPPPGTNGNGSTKNPGVISVLNATSNAVIARFDLSNEDDSTDRAELTFPLTLAPQEYLITIDQGGNAMGGTSPFYFMLHSIGGGNPLETQEAMNNAVGTPEALTSVANGDFFSNFVEGDLPDADADHFLLQVEGEALFVACGGLRSGSGATVRATVLDGAATIAMDTETAAITGGLFIENVDVTGLNTVVVKIDKTAQDAAVAGNYYRCGFAFGAPSMP